MGLSMSDAIRLLLVRVADERRLPFPVQTPNDATTRAIEELERGGGKRFGSAEELFQDFEIQNVGAHSVDPVQARCQEGRKDRPEPDQAASAPGAADSTNWE